MRLRIYVLLVVFISTVASADIVTFQALPKDASTEYVLTISNEPADGPSLFDLFLLVPKNLDFVHEDSIGVPAGWGDDKGGLLFYGTVDTDSSFIEWVADAGGTFDVIDGQSLSGFSFLIDSPLDQSGLRYSLNGSTDLQSFQAPQSVPDCPPGVTFGTSLVCLAAVRKKLGLGLPSFRSIPRR